MWPSLTVGLLTPSTGQRLGRMKRDVESIDLVTQNSNAIEPQQKPGFLVLESRIVSVLSFDNYFAGFADKLLS